MECVRVHRHPRKCWFRMVDPRAISGLRFEENATAPGAQTGRRPRAGRSCSPRWPTSLTHRPGRASRPSGLDAAVQPFTATERQAVGHAMRALVSRYGLIMSVASRSTLYPKERERRRARLTALTEFHRSDPRDRSGARQRAYTGHFDDRMAVAIGLQRAIDGQRDAAEMGIHRRGNRVGAGGASLCAYPQPTLSRRRGSPTGTDAAACPDPR
jgi:hypothetical protein